VPNATVGAYQVASGIDWSRRGRVVCDQADFPSVAHVWLAQRAAGADVRFAGSVDEQLSLIGDRVAMVSVPLVDYADGRRRPVRRIADAAHEAGARVFVDAYQAVGVEPVDVRQLDCDFLVAGCMKYLLGLPGLAFLYARSPAGADRLPVLTGWFGRVDPFAFDARRLDFPAAARRFETGTPAIPACYASSAGLRLVGGLDLRVVRNHVLRLTTLATTLLTAQGEAVRASAPDERGAHIGLADPDPARLATWLAGRRIVTSPHGDLLRLSFHFYNDARDVEALCDAVAEYRCESFPPPVIRSTTPR
jgi:selenocysteine lyase/cysteine desulfurase